ncbi:tRNA (pseudouridine(54)-N(1))-methyltransferase TrmY [Paraferrimonas sp. SM1919]|uniref:tRNA (pseudouridine(54)-N(1))-methyltransferase TrmY n=1 Tax=Paraferrimonas sp. SM1919 TaxID=2662263 RepID=UPI0013D8B361|nr:tRNA (pseudouridine(54)-N(1))-methyltransferase TrmY [Paraferrimonas sp. SM1919]
MRTFVLRARSAPTDPELLLSGVGGDNHTEILAHTLMNGIFVAQSHRSDVTVHLVLESTKDYSRTISFTSDELTGLTGFDEQSLLAKVKLALTKSLGMGKEQTRQVEPGISVRTISFEKLIAELSQTQQLYMMSPKGEYIHDIEFADNPCFLLTDHIPMPKKSFNSLKRLGCENISLGPKMLFASQCITLIHHALDMN